MTLFCHLKFVRPLSVTLTSRMLIRPGPIMIAYHYRQILLARPISNSPSRLKGLGSPSPQDDNDKDTLGLIWETLLLWPEIRETRAISLPFPRARMDGITSDSQSRIAIFLKLLTICGGCTYPRILQPRSAWWGRRGVDRTRKMHWKAKKIPRSGTSTGQKLCFCLLPWLIWSWLGKSSTEKEATSARQLKSAQFCQQTEQRDRKRSAELDSALFQGRRPVMNVVFELERTSSLSSTTQWAVGLNRFWFTLKVFLGVN